MMGLTASCKTKVNCSGEDTLLKLTTACATCAMWLCTSCRWPNNLVMASCPFLSNACMFPCRRILDVTSGPVGMLHWKHVAVLCLLFLQDVQERRHIPCLVLCQVQLLCPYL